MLQLGLKPAEHPKTTTLRKAMKRMDAVSMNLDRRFFHALYTADPEALVSIHAYSDGSCTRGLRRAYFVNDFGSHKPLSV